MTKQRDPINGLVNQLLTKPPLQTELLADLIADLADSPEAIAELDTLSSTLTGEPSTLLAMVQRVRDYQACLDLLSAYVEAELARGDLTQRYPTVAEHIRTYPRFRQQYELLLTTLREDAQGSYGVAPSDMTFAAWFAQGQPAAEPAPAPQVAIWQQMAQGINRLVAEIPIWFSKGMASFGQLPSTLTPQPAPALAYRQRLTPPADPASEALATVWELPFTIGNRDYKLRLGAVENQRGALIVEAALHEPAQSLVQARVTLHDHEGELLESTATSEQGIAFFRNLEMGKYYIQVEHAGQVDEFSVALNQRS